VRIALLGVGLIGGSIARAMRRLPVDQRPWIAAWSPTDGARDARTDGVVDEFADDPEDALVGADLVILAGPASTIPGWIARLIAPADLGAALGPDTTVTDVASTKVAVLAAADAAALRFVGGHPMAGRESSGYAASAGDLFVGRPWVVVRGAHARDADIDRVDWLARSCGARPVEMTAVDHDEATAAISHLPLLLSAALVEAVVGQDAALREPGPTSELASTGWASMTRLARGDPTMGAGILATNATPVLERLRILQETLETWRVALEQEGGPDEEEIRSRLATTRTRLERAWPERGTPPV
jgi:prephenate dehydrogenase